MATLEVRISYTPSQQPPFLSMLPILLTSIDGINLYTIAYTNYQFSIFYWKNYNTAIRHWNRVSAERNDSGQYCSYHVCKFLEWLILIMIYGYSCHIQCLIHSIYISKIGNFYAQYEILYQTTVSTSIDTYRYLLSRRSIEAVCSCRSP